MKGVFIALLAFSFLKLFSQDVIIFENGDTVKAKVLSETSTEVVYKKVNSPADTLTYMVSKALIAMIRYENGTQITLGRVTIAKNETKGNKRRAERRARRIIVNDPDTWNHTIINYWENPALTGEDRQVTQTTDFDNDHSGDYIRVGFEVTVHTKKRITWAIGPHFAMKRFGSESGNGRLTVGIAGSFKYQFQNQAVISGGVSLGYVVVRTSAFSSYDFFEAHQGNTTFNPQVEEGWDSAWTFDTEYTRFGPLNLGVWYNGKNYFAGASIGNVTRYNESVFDERQPSPLYFSIVAGYHFNIKGKAFLTPSLIYRTQGFSLHSVTPRLTVSLSRSRLLLGTYYQDRRIYGVFGFDLATHFQVTFSLGGSVASQDIRPDIYFAGTIRIHFINKEKDKEEK